MQSNAQNADHYLNDLLMAVKLSATNEMFGLNYIPGKRCNDDFVWNAINTLGLEP